MVMNEEMVYRWNKNINTESIVYHLGDFTFNKPEYIIPRLNFKTLIWLKGNHDKSKYGAYIDNRIIYAGEYLELKIEQNIIVLCHYPFHTWNRSHYGSYHFHGHCHGGLDKSNKGTNRYDVGVDANQHDYYPQKLEWILQNIESLKTDK